jgi:acetoin utilization deacetylase AcuC-like enzyme
MQPQLLRHRADEATCVTANVYPAAAAQSSASLDAISAAPAGCSAAAAVGWGPEHH